MDELGILSPIASASREVDNPNANNDTLCKYEILKANEESEAVGPANGISTRPVWLLHVTKVSVSLETLLHFERPLLSALVMPSHHEMIARAGP